jgi:hypothetical protein
MVHESAKIVTLPTGEAIRMVTGGTFTAKWPERADHTARMAAKKAARK